MLVLRQTLTSPERGRHYHFLRGTSKTRDLACAYCNFFSALIAAWAFSMPPTFSISALAAIRAPRSNEPPPLAACRALAPAPDFLRRRLRRNPAAARVLLTSVLETITPFSFNAAMMSRGQTRLPSARAV